MIQSKGIRGAFFFAVLGALTSLSFAPVSFFPIVFFSLPLLVKSIDFAKTKKQAFFIGGWFGFGLFSAGLYWVGFSFLAQTNVPQWSAPIAVMALAGALSMFVAFSFVAAFHFWRAGSSRVIVFSISFVLFEWLRGHMFTGFPWHQMAHIWSDTPLVMQSVSLVGSYGLSFLTVLVASSLVLFFDKPASGRKLVVVPAIIIAILVTGFGYYRLQMEVKYYPDVRLRLVQANIPQVEKWPREYWLRNVNKHINLSTSTDEKQPPTHVIWPETAVPYDLHNIAEVRSVIMEGLGGNTHLITGVPRVERFDNDEQNLGGMRLYNSIVGINPNAEIAMTYDKFHLVPFGEYIPLMDVLGRFGIDKFVEGEVGFSTGAGLETHSLSGLPPFSPLICYEIIFPSSVRADENASWILNLTNDAWFGDSFGPYQHFAQAKFRAIEEGVAVVRVAGTGISGVIDPWGRVIGKINLFEQGYLDASLPKPTFSNTPYSKLGNLAFFLLLLGSLLWLIYIVKRENKL